jgi:3-oxoacyl-[acyl-carrier protein] reductase
VKTLPGKVALVTGASRGIGAAVAQKLAEQGADVALNYRSKAARAEEVAKVIETFGQRALLVKADITSEDETKAMFSEIEKQFGRLDVLILNASGGLEKDKAADYAVQLNVTAQVSLLELALSLMPKGSRVIFVTSHLAHFYGTKPVYSYYEPVAASKKAGEEALRSCIPELSDKGISLVVVSGDLIEGTITPKLMQRNSPGLIEARRDEVGSLPTVNEFAEAIVKAVLDPSLQTGATIFVGSTEWGVE